VADQATPAATGPVATPETSAGAGATRVAAAAPGAAFRITATADAEVIRAGTALPEED